MSTLRNKLVRLIIEETLDELPKYPAEVAKDVIKMYELSDDNLIIELESIIQYHKNND